MKVHRVLAWIFWNNSVRRGKKQRKKITFSDYNSSEASSSGCVLLLDLAVNWKPISIYIHENVSFTLIQNCHRVRVYDGHNGTYIMWIKDFCITMDGKIFESLLYRPYT